jgi:UDP-N-acetylglucosamine/UDP-N-acetylgalactosamine 4-epimerase
LDQTVVGLDNFLTGSRDNLEAIQREAGGEACSRFQFLEGDLRDAAVCRQACSGVNLVLHQAALGSVTRSLDKPADSHIQNTDTFINLLVAAREAGVQAFVYASSSSVYGDHQGLPKREELIGRPLSPYALTKWINELYADLFARCHGMSSIGLRYFNVFGPRQNTKGPYAAVIPQWIAAMAKGQPVCINGDGESSRDFCHVANVVQANLLAADWLCGNPQPPHAQIFNVAAGSRTSLNDLFLLIRNELAPHFPGLAERGPVYGPFRAGDIRHSQADITKAQQVLGYVPSHDLAKGLGELIRLYLQASR